MNARATAALGDDWPPLTVAQQCHESDAGKVCRPDASMLAMHRARNDQMETFSALLAICAGNSPVTGEFPHKGQRRGALMFSLIWINGWVNTREAGDLRRHHAHYDVTVMKCRAHLKMDPGDHTLVRVSAWYFDWYMAPDKKDLNYPQTFSNAHLLNVFWWKFQWSFFPSSSVDQVCVCLVISNKEAIIFYLHQWPTSQMHLHVKCFKVHLSRNQYIYINIIISTDTNSENKQ